MSTKIGGKLKPFFPEKYTLKYLEPYINSSLKNLKIECVDLLQLHCPPKQVIENYELHNQMEKLKKKGKIKRFGFSIFSIEEANSVINFDNISSIQIVINLFRQNL